MADYNVASVRFSGGYKEYHYKTILLLEEGECVITDSRNGLGIAFVVNPNTEDPDERTRATSWILDRVQLTQLRERIRSFEQLNETSDL